MSTDYYSITGNPVFHSDGLSSIIRSEFSLIMAGFAKLPTLTANGNKAVIVNGAGTALATTVGTLAIAGGFATTGAFNLALAVGASVTLTTPVVNGTLATLAGVETFSNKIIDELETTNNSSISDGLITTFSDTVTINGIILVSEPSTFLSTLTVVSSISGANYKVAGVQVVGEQETGWAAMTGSANKGTTYNTSTVTLVQLATRVKALQDALDTHGLIGT